MNNQVVLVGTGGDFYREKKHAGFTLPLTCFLEVTVKITNMKDERLRFEAKIRHVALQTLAVLIHRTLGRAHPGVRWPHAGALHGPAVDVFSNALVVHAIHGLKQAKHRC